MVKLKEHYPDVTIDFQGKVSLNSKGYLIVTHKYQSGRDQNINYQGLMRDITSVISIHIMFY